MWQIKAEAVRKCRKATGCWGFLLLLLLFFCYFHILKQPGSIGSILHSHLLPFCVTAVIMTYFLGGHAGAPSRSASISSCLRCDTWRAIVINCTHLGGRSGQLMRRCLGQNVITPIQRTGGRARMISVITERQQSWRQTIFFSFHPHYRVIRAQIAEGTSSLFPLCLAALTFTTYSESFHFFFK